MQILSLERHGFKDFKRRLCKNIHILENYPLVCYKYELFMKETIYIQLLKSVSNYGK